MTTMYRLSDRLPFAPIVAAMFAGVAVVLVLATPHWLFEHWVAKSGLAELLPAAAPPLGDKARIATALGLGAVAGAAIWLTIAMAEAVLRRSRSDASGHATLAQVAAIRGPLFADKELGAPLMSEAAMTQARDELVLDTPLAEAAEVDEVDGYAPRKVHDQAAQHEDQAEQPSTVLPQPVADEPIGALLDRLDAAMARKPARRRSGRGDPLGWRPALRGQADAHRASTVSASTR